MPPWRINAYDGRDLARMIAMLDKVPLGACLLVLAACATHPSAPSTAANAQKQSVACGSPDSATRLTAGAAPCIGPGTVHTGGALDRTGQASTADALGMVDPTLTIHAH